MNPFNDREEDNDENGDRESADGVNQHLLKGDDQLVKDI